MAQTPSKFTAQERSSMITLAWLAGAAVSVTDVVGGARAEAREGGAVHVHLERPEQAERQRRGAIGHDLGLSVARGRICSSREPLRRDSEARYAFPRRLYFDP